MGPVGRRFLFLPGLSLDLQGGKHVRRAEIFARSSTAEKPTIPQLTSPHSFSLLEPWGFFVIKGLILNDFYLMARILDRIYLQLVSY